MDWQSPYLLLLILPALVLLFLFDARTVHPMGMSRRRALLVVRAVLVILAVAALAWPVLEVKSKRQAVVLMLDHSRSQGEEGMKESAALAGEVLRRLPGDALVGIVSAGKDGRVLRTPDLSRKMNEPDVGLLETDGSQTNLSSAFDLAQALFPAGRSRHVICIGDGLETAGDFERTAREAAVAGIRIHTLGVAGEKRPDVRVVKVLSSQSRVHEGASLELAARIESSLDGKGVIKLYENGLEIDSQEVELKVGEDREVRFRCSPERRNIYNYRVVASGFEGDAIPENNEALAIVDVRGKPLVLYVEGEENESHYLVEAMSKEGIRLQPRPVSAVPDNLQDLAGYDAVILSDVPAHKLSERHMVTLRDYVDKLGGGFVMIGGMNSFGVGGYYRTPIEEFLPVKLKSPDTEEQQSTALALVVDRSGSMSGQKIQLCRSAAIATAQILTKKDYLTVIAFDSNATTIVPMTRVVSPSAISSQIATINSGGGTNIFPGMSSARTALQQVRAKIKHMIVLTDGQTGGSGYEALAASIRAEGVTISTVAVGSGAAVGLLQSIAAAGGGQAYVTMDPTTIPRIFTQDTMVHTGRMIREEAFKPVQVERHPMLKNWEDFESPPLLGYVKTIPKSTAQAPLVTDLGDPLLAHWRYGLGRVTAFTSDCKSRWAALWITGWDGYSQLWAQILRETARQPQGLDMDIRVETTGEEAKFFVDLREDAATFRNEAAVRADIYFVPANALGSSMKLIGSQELEQEGPGLYQGSFRPDKGGVYLVRAQAGASMVSSGYVHNPSSEAATGRVNDPLLKEAARLTGGTALKSPADKLQLRSARVERLLDLRPPILFALLFLLMADVAIRRWENVRGMVEQIGGILRAKNATG